MDKPLAERMRPNKLSEVVGHQRLLRDGTALSRLITGEQQTSRNSLILWGPPGSGKTTLARLLANQQGADFVELSAISASVQSVRDVIEAARKSRELFDRPTFLFLDEIHRFSKSQQDSLLGAVESGIITLIAATTENPSFSVIKPLLSRAVLIQLDPLEKSDVEAILRRALDREMSSAQVDDEALELIAQISSGDARRALTILENAAAFSQNVTREVVLESSAMPLSYDHDGQMHYDTISAFIKSVRGSDVDSALHYLARMIESGEDPRFIARRIIILASEDIGLADPQALQVAVAAHQAVELIGMPEGRIALAEATIYLSLAPKSNRAYQAINQALEDLRIDGLGPIPTALRSTGATGYFYPHDDPRGISKQTYSELKKNYYEPSSHGLEKDLQLRLKLIREILGK